MFIGIDHGTSALRFSAGDGRRFKIPREDAVSFRIEDLTALGRIEEIEGIALTYSMGDNFSAITPLRSLVNRGLVSREGAGKHTGGGTRVFDQVAESGIPAVAIPGLHRGSPTDPRFFVYSHQASPEKVGIAYRVVEDLGGDVVISDVSSNTVSILVKEGRLEGALDACIFAPGTEHGALDVGAIRKVDRGDLTANEAFLHAGVNHTLPPESRIPALALFSAMECAALLLLNPAARIALAGTMAPLIAGEVGTLLGKEVAVYDEWCAADGLALIAARVFAGTRDILGLDVRC
ncbi:MAG: methanogenesis marker 12 protein [Methanolinea sp.]|jgi:putative methanogenesis marker protein 12|nr:methanogenesis marker 12 protein [Methanolinea sp.]